MFHRIQLKNRAKISDIYSHRNMLHTEDELYKIIDNRLKNGFKFGSIEEALQNKNIFHLSFDDGYFEHLEVAQKLKLKYNLSYFDVSFAINIRNSFFNEKISMDLIYAMFDNHLIKEKEIPNLKKELFSKSKNDILNYFKKYQKLLKKIYLENNEVVELSKLFSIVSHGINHLFLNSDINHNSENLKYEILDSKLFLEEKLKIKINTFCFPDGKNSPEIQEMCKKSGYKNALAINGTDDIFDISRIIERA
jgi:hypothetical protein